MENFKPDQGEKERRNVVHVMSELRPGGVEIRTLELIHYLDRTNVDHRVVTLSGSAGTLAVDYENAGVPVTPMTVRSLTFAFRFIRYLRSASVDVVHAHVDHSNGYIVTLARIARVPIRVSHYRSDTPDETALSGRIKRSLLKAMTWLNATVIAGVSPTVLEAAWTPRWQKNRRCQVLLNGFDIEYFQNVESDDLRGELSIPHDANVLMHIGRAVPTKNRPRAVEIVAELCRRGTSDWRLVFVGRDGPDEREGALNRSNLIELSTSLGLSESQVLFAGERSEVATVLPSADVLLVTSSLEGLPGVVLEGVACGVPVVATDLPGVRYIADSGLDIGTVALSQSTEEWANEIESRLAANGTTAGRFQAQLGIFSMKTVSQSYLRVWGGALSE